MITLASKIPSYWLAYHTGWPKILPINLTVSVTYRCNSRCFTCNITEKEGGKELSFEEFDQILKTVGNPYWITLSGGEPFLRDDLKQICMSLYKNCKPHIINIPTNGLIAEIAETVGLVTKEAPNTRWIVNLSVDGIGEKHDKIRGVKGNFKKIIETFYELKGLKRKNLSVGVHTVISAYNVNDIEEIHRYVTKELKPDSFITEIAEERNELNNIGSAITPSADDYAKAIDYLIENMKVKNYAGTAQIAQAFRLEYYKNVKMMLMQKKQVIACYAGITSAQIAPDGDVWFCCIKAETIGNLRDNNYDFRSIWFSDKAKSMRNSIRRSNCYCPLANASYTNMLMNPKTLAKVLMRLI